MAYHPSFNPNPDLESYELIVLLVSYSILCVLIVSLNYLTLRTFMVTKPLLPRQRYFLGYLACVDVAVGLVSIPSLLYDMSHWPSYGFFVYQASDCLTGFSSGFVLCAVSIQGIRCTFEPPTRCTGQNARDIRGYHRVITAATIVSAGVAGLNVMCLLGRAPFGFFFYVVIGLLAVIGILLLVTSLVVLVVLLCGKTREGGPLENKNVTKSLTITSCVYVITWAVPYAILTYNNFCNFCIPILAVYLYIARMLFYVKSLVIPLLYIYNVPYFREVVKRIVTQDCFAIPDY